MVPDSEMLYLRDKMDEQGKLLFEVHGTVKAINQHIKAQNGRVKKSEEKIEDHERCTDELRSKMDMVQGAIGSIKVFGAIITIILGITAIITYFKPM